MIKHIQVVPLKVTDLDAALAFYTEKVGLEVGMDVTMNDGYRWVTVKVPGTPGPEITLMLTPADQIEEGRGSGFAFHSDDCAATHKALAARGVEFTEVPTKQPWGIQAQFKDLDGTTHVIIQPLPYEG